MKIDKALIKSGFDFEESFTPKGFVDDVIAVYSNDNEKIAVNLIDNIYAIVPISFDSQDVYESLDEFRWFSLKDVLLLL